jgi:hypothetical protein
MPEIAQYNFSLTEVVEALIKKADLHEGMWQLQVNLNLGAGNFASDPNTALPGAIVTIGEIGLTKGEPSSPRNLVVDASLVNPAKRRTVR